MRLLSRHQVVRTVEITGRYRAHGSPVQIGEPASIGIANLDVPDYGDPVSIAPGEVPIFWDCGVTS